MQRTYLSWIIPTTQCYNWNTTMQGQTLIWEEVLQFVHSLLLTGIHVCQKQHLPRCVHLRGKHYWRLYGLKGCEICGTSISGSVEASVAHSKGTRSPLPRLSLIERGHHMDGWPIRAGLCSPTVVDFPSTQNSVRTQYLTKVIRTKNRGPSVCIHM